MEDNRKTNNRDESSELSRKDIKFVRFEDFTYFAKNRKIVKSGRTLSLTPIPAQILNYLILNQGKSITKQELINYVWPHHREIEDGAHKAVNNFSQAIRKLRSDLGEKEKPWRYIENPAQNIFSLRPKVKIYKKLSLKRVSHILRNLFLFLITASAVTAAALRDNSNALTAFEAEQLTEIKGQEKRAAVSHDKSTLLFMHKPINSNGWNLRAKNLLTGESKVIVSAQNKSIYNAEPSFSPSGTKIAWVETDYKDHCKVLIADFNQQTLEASNLKEIADCSVAWFARTPNWKNEDQIVVSISQGLNQPNGIKQIDIHTFEQTVVTSPKESEYGDFGLSVHFEAQVMAYLRQSVKSGTGSELRLYNFENNSDTLLKIYREPVYSIAWVDGESLLARGDGAFEIINLDGDTFPVNLSSNAPLSFPFRVADHEIGFLKGALRDDDVVIIDLESKQTDYSLSTTSHDYRVVIAKNARKIVHLTQKQDKRELILKDENSSRTISSYSKNAAILDLAISPDGRFIGVVEDSQLSIFNNTGNIVYRKNTTVFGLAFSEDSESLLFGEKSSGQVLIKRLDLTSSNESVVTAGFLPKTMQNGDIYFFNINKINSTPTLYKITPEGEVTMLLSAPYPVMTLNSSGFDVINEEIYYVKSVEDKLLLVKRNIKTGVTQTITPITNRQFSINNRFKLAVTTAKGVVQNNLTYFTLVK